MKTIKITILLLICWSTALAQNTFPTPSGNVGIGISTPLSKLHLYHDDSEVSANVGLTIEQDGTGDSKLQFLLTGVQRWVAGIDNSDGDKFIIGRGLDWSQSKNFVIDNSGHVGIGTLTPSKEFEVNGTILSNNFMSSASNTTYNHFIRNGTGAALYINQVESNASLPILRLSSGTATANQNVRFTVENDGSVGIGTTNLEGYRLAVNGSIRSKEVKVEANWSDFVFSDNYQLRTLEEVEQHINENGHLPEIPSEAEVTENGINLGEMNAKLLMKIEELTLYLIEQNNQNQAQQARIERLEEKISRLENE
ncbi:hypothetical protein [Marinoscillum sp. 108]|uniref:hypothetical protein n=1 Tax=Marinoscillum sp. 108 TaxID=2653151 RepID=UPI00135BB7EA|nr:hypothetical protein [Marinoscillum sp. 108]